MRTSIVIVAASFLAVSCGQSGESMEMYAVANSQNADHFISDLASLAQQHGLKPNVGSATDDKGHTLHVLEAKGRWMRLWSQNMPMSGQENPAACGKYEEAHLDPGQYIVSIKPSLPFLDSRSSAEVAGQLRQELRRLGYEVLDKPLLCSSLAKSRADAS